MISLLRALVTAGTSTPSNVTDNTMPSIGSHVVIVVESYPSEFPLVGFTLVIVHPLQIPCPSSERPGNCTSVATNAVPYTTATKATAAEAIFIESDGSQFIGAKATRCIV